jgi:hypothetical protein
VVPTSAIPLSIELANSAHDVRRFIDFAWELYDAKRYPNWVPPLRMSVADALSEKHPFFADAERALFLAVRGRQVVGRIAAIANQAHNRFQGDDAGFFGFFECVDDQDVADALFDAAAEWLAGRGLTSMRGPFNPSTNYECGLLVDGYERRPTFMTAWNPPYYDQLCTRAGLKKSKDLLAFWFSTEGDDFAIPPILERHGARASGAGITLREIEPRYFERETAVLWDIYNDAWEANWGFVPFTEAEFRHLAADVRHLLAPELCFIASVDGVPAAFLLSVPDFNETLRFHRSGRLFPMGLLRLLWHKKRARSYRVMAMGVRAAYRSRPILARFTLEMLRRGRATNKAGAEASWLLEDNHLIVKSMRALGATERMRWRLYERSTAADAEVPRDA